MSTLDNTAANATLPEPTAAALRWSCYILATNLAVTFRLIVLCIGLIFQVFKDFLRARTVANLSRGNVVAG
ncbi:uncharacterized protein PHACADRAFT_259063 [Phanerochaete carnosa HHB-10118-sp]|uniref:Uncharacterized protein n=1 Tax=Phanerochaete carnosa (strain HHB-10118-sp) TaxID=650164 RepID=K5UXT0_PHACS|nr:uncharacterized protein PHACADRAFT_259063 [Phanerochaete carnosa HHB-10118-sp]EKM54896.1 hypothetical protein PHACADRAFT_259063 [Phanerochaete carnosa HHB-10118-sp]